VFIPHKILAWMVRGGVIASCAYQAKPHVPLVVNTTKAMWNDYWEGKRAVERAQAAAQAASAKAQAAVQSEQIRAEAKTNALRLANERLKQTQEFALREQQLQLEEAARQERLASNDDDTGVSEAPQSEGASLASASSDGSSDCSEDCGPPASNGQAVYAAAMK